MHLVLSVAAAVSLAMVLLAPSLKLRFGLGDVQVYYLPFAVYAGALLMANVAMIAGLQGRIRSASLFLLMLAGPLLGYFVGNGVASDLLTGLSFNLSLGALVLLYPWDTRSLHHFLHAVAVIGALVGLVTILFYGSDEQLAEVGDDYLLSYLQVSFAMGAGVICATYLVVRSLNPVSVLVFGVCWLGLGVARGRGALIFAILVSVIYLLAVLCTRISGFSGRKKFTLIVLLASFIPVVVAQTTKVARYGDSLKRIFMDTEVEADEGGRGLAFRTAIDQIEQSPIVGNGLGAYLDNPVNYPHNIVLQWGADSGLFGIVLLVAFFLMVARAFLVGITRSGADTINLVYACGAMSAYVLLHYLKSGDAYVGRDFHLLIALPVVAMLAVTRSRAASQSQGRKRRRRRPSRSRSLGLPV